MTTKDGNLLLTMPSGSVGTLLANNHYVWYGKTSARMKTSRGAGVITAFILLSDVKDEIDYEWVGVDLQTAQTNYYFQGILDCKSYPAPSLSGTILPEVLTLGQQTKMARTPLSRTTPLRTSTSTRSTGSQTKSPGQSMVKSSVQ